MNKKISIWKKIKEFMSTKKENEQFKQLKKTAYQRNPKKAQREQINFYLIIFMTIIVFVSIGNTDIIILPMIITFFAFCTLILQIDVYIAQLKKIVEISDQEIQHSKENVEY